MWCLHVIYLSSLKNLLVIVENYLPIYLSKPHYMLTRTSHRRLCTSFAAITIVLS
jgi:hypothetical protein